MESFKHAYSLAYNFEQRSKEPMGKWFDTSSNESYSHQIQSYEKYRLEQSGLVTSQESNSPVQQLMDKGKAPMNLALEREDGEKDKKEKKEASGESLNTICKKLFEQDSQDTKVVSVDVRKETEIPLLEKETPLEVSSLPSEFGNVILEPLSELPPMGKIPYVTDLLPYSPLPYISPHSVNLIENEELNIQVKELKELDFVHKNLVPLTCPTVPNLKKAKILSICINKIDIKNRFPKIIVSDRDVKHISYSLKAWRTILGTKLKCPSAYHLKTNWQVEVVNKKPVDLIPLPLKSKVSEPTDAFEKHIHELHSKIRMTINLNNEHYKSIADIHCRLQEFSEGDMVMICIHPKQILVGKVRKLYVKKMGHFKSLKEISSNAYMIDTPIESYICNVFNVENLTTFIVASSFVDTSISNPTGNTSPFSIYHAPEPKKLPLPPSPPIFKNRDDIEEILDDKTMITRAGSYQKFWVK
ncbi:uncharacterized protein LOC131143782 [Malania oleifera]|uniref:uncharacterized protein LOC131143782 n=1 Tax=Malania oleifera TaxID=397392 RepID=UPI0025AE6C29|nr:uncharacterized protein LOC131143782 [Malania oleifera]